MTNRAEGARFFYYFLLILYCEAKYTNSYYKSRAEGARFFGGLLRFNCRLSKQTARRRRAKKIVLLKAIYGVQNLKYLVSDDGPQDISVCPELRSCPIVRTLLGQWEKNIGKQNLVPTDLWFRTPFRFRCGLLDTMHQ